MYDHELFLEVGECARERRNEHEFLRNRRSVVIEQVDPLELLHAVYGATEQNDRMVKSYGWYDEDEDSDSHLLGRAPFYEIAAVLAGHPAKEAWRIKNPRKVVAPLVALVRGGLLGRGSNASGGAYGFCVVDDGMAMIHQAAELERLDADRATR